MSEGLRPREHRATLRPRGRRCNDVFGKLWLFKAICRIDNLSNRYAPDINRRTIHDHICFYLLKTFNLIQSTKTFHWPTRSADAPKLPETNPNSESLSTGTSRSSTSSTESTHRTSSCSGSALTVTSLQSIFRSELFLNVVAHSANCKKWWPIYMLCYWC